MTVLGLVVCVIAIAVVENEQYKDLRDRNKRQGLAYGLSLFFFRDKNTLLYDRNNKSIILKEDKIMSMYDETKKVLEGCDEVMNMAVSQMDFNDFLGLDENNIKAMVTVGKLYAQSKDLVLKQAEIMDKLERQNDELLEKVNVLLARTKAIQESGDPSGSPILFLFNLGQIY